MGHAKRSLSWLGAAALSLGFSVPAAHAQSPNPSSNRSYSVPASGWTGYAQGTAWNGYAPGAAWVYYSPARPRRTLAAPSQYREFGTGRGVALAKPWLPGTP